MDGLFLPPDLTPEQLQQNFIKRRAWVKFGDCTGQQSGVAEPGITIISREAKFELGPSVQKTPKDPKFLSLSNDKIDHPIQTITNDSPSEKKSERTAYVPPHMRNQKTVENKPVNNNNNHISNDHHNGNGNYNQNNGNSNYKQNNGGYNNNSQRNEVNGEKRIIKISNLSELVTEGDVKELVKPFGRYEKIFLAKDRRTGLNKGFAFVTFQNEASAYDAISSIDGHPYDYQILRAEWSKPRERY